MKTYLLFIFGNFTDHEDVEFFCAEVLGDTPSIKTIRYVIESLQNIIVIFESDTDSKEMAHELYGILTNENIKFYFIFDRENLVTAHLPEQMKDFIYKPYTEFEIMHIDFIKKDQPIMDLDGLLDKIEKMGIESLTPEEKNFLDNFDK